MVDHLQDRGFRRNFNEVFIVYVVVLDRSYILCQNACRTLKVFFAETCVGALSNDFCLFVPVQYLDRFELDRVSHSLVFLRLSAVHVVPLLRVVHCLVSYILYSATRIYIQIDQVVYTWEHFDTFLIFKCC